jgi:hypothetical protein
LEDSTFSSQIFLENQQTWFIGSDFLEIVGDVLSKLKRTPKIVPQNFCRLISIWVLLEASF